jgi:predicted nucleotidyltransferase
MADPVDALLRAATLWAANEDRIAALGLLGSRARGTPRPDSDVDLLVLTGSVAAFFDDVRWVERFGRATRSASEDWGRVRSLRVWYPSGLEVEFSFAPLDWAARPLDSGTARVLRDGCRVLFDRSGVLAAALSP